MLIFEGLMSVLIVITFLCLSFYVLLKSRRIGDLGLSRRFVLLMFLCKCLVGAVMLYAYDGHFEDRNKADVYKFYDDAGIMVDGFYNSPKDFLNMLTGAGEQSRYQSLYYNQMQNWNRQYDHGFSNDNRFMIRVNALMRLMMFDNIWAVMIVCNLLFITILLFLIQIFVQPNWQSRWFMVLLLIIPSGLIWNSFMLKETFALIGMGCLLIAFFGNHKDIIRLFYGLLGLLILLNIKIFLLLFLLPIMAVFFVGKNRTELGFNAKKYGIAALTAITLFFAFAQTDFLQNRIEALSFKQQDFKNLSMGGVILKNDTAYCHILDENRRDVIYQSDLGLLNKSHGLAKIKMGAAFTYLRLPNTKDTIHVQNYNGKASFKVIFDNPKSGSIVYLPSFSNDAYSLMAVVPFALFNTVFKPIPFEFNAVFINLVGFENLLILILFVLAVIYRCQTLNFNAIFACMSLVFLVYLIIGVTTPVLGAIVRYKTLMLPFLWYVCFLIIDFKRLEKLKGIKWVKLFVLREPPQV